MISGLHARPDPWYVSEEDFEKAKLFDYILIPLYSYNGNPDWLAKQKTLCWRYMSKVPNIIYRLCSSGWQEPGDYVNEWLPVLDGLPEGMVQMDNEPNHQGENFGGDGYDVAEKYNKYWIDRRNILKLAKPDIKLIFPGLVVMQRDLEWLDICRDAISLSDYLGCHIYWQYGNYNSVYWGKRYELYQDTYPNKEIIITEYGDSTPGRSSSDKAQVYRNWLGELTGVKAACVFLASSPDPTWSEFELSLEDCKVINAVSEPQELWFQCPNYTPGRTHDIDMIIIHSTRGGQDIGVEAQATINWFTNPNSQASAHAMITQSGQLVHFVSDYDTAWGAGEHNSSSLQVELEQPDDDTPFSKEQVNKLIEITQWWCVQHDIPIDDDHIKGHDQTPQGKRYGKTDPGKMFNWENFWNQVI